MKKTLAHTAALTFALTFARTFALAFALTKVPLGRKQYLPSIMTCVAVFTGALYQLRTSSIAVLPLLYLVFSFAFVYFSLRRLSDTGLSRWWAIAPPLCIVGWVALIVRFAISPTVPFLTRVTLIAIPLLAVCITLVMALVPSKRIEQSNLVH